MTISWISAEQNATSFNVDINIDAKGNVMPEYSDISLWQQTDYLDKGNAIDEICLNLTTALDTVPCGKILVRQKNGTSV